jgi:hypothetical protein
VDSGCLFLARCRSRRRRPTQRSGIGLTLSSTPPQRRVHPLGAVGPFTPSGGPLSQEPPGHPSPKEGTFGGRAGGLLGCRLHAYAP